MFSKIFPVLFHIGLANDEKALKSEAKKVGKHKDKDSVVAKEEKPTMEDRRKAKEELKQKMEEERRKRKEEKDKVIAPAICLAKSCTV